MNDPAERLSRQMRFIVEMDRLKGVLRRTYTADGSRHENSAEHSWHIALMAVVLAEYAPAGTDMSRVVKMLLVHDLVEIDAGDTYCYDKVAAQDKQARERAAADRIFALLPADQAAEVRGLWDEFEAMSTPEARFANAMDRLEPVLIHPANGGKSWSEHNITRDQVIARNCLIERGSPTLWAYARQVIDDAVARGILAR